MNMDLDISTKQAGVLASIPTWALIAELEKRLTEVNLMRSAAARLLSNLSGALGSGGTVSGGGPVLNGAGYLEAVTETEEEKAGRAGMTVPEYRDAMKRALEREALKTAEKKQKDEDRLAAMRAGYKGKGATQRWIADGRPSVVANPEQEQLESSPGIAPGGASATETPEAA
jgi:hypothetical protein